MRPPTEAALRFPFGILNGPYRGPPTRPGGGFSSSSRGATCLTGGEIKTRGRANSSPLNAQPYCVMRATASITAMRVEPPKIAIPRQTRAGIEYESKWGWSSIPSSSCLFGGSAIGLSVTDKRHRECAVIIFQYARNLRVPSEFGTRRWIENVLPSTDAGPARQ